jgi:hypothetical protein
MSQRLCRHGDKITNMRLAKEKRAMRMLKRRYQHRPTKVAEVVAKPLSLFEQKRQEMRERMRNEN